MKRAGFLLLCTLYMASCNDKQMDGGFAHVPDASFSVNTLADTGLVNTAIRNGNRWVNIQPDSSIPFFLRAVQEAAQIGYTEGMAIALNNLACFYGAKHDQRRAQYYASQLQMTLNKIPGIFYNPYNAAHRKLLEQKNNYKAADFYRRGHYDSALSCYVTTLRIAGTQDSVNYACVVDAYMGIATVASFTFRHELAESYFNMAAVIAEQYGDSILSISCLSNMASVQYNIGNYDKALNIGREALARSEQMNEHRHSGNILNAISTSLLKLNKPEEALPYSRKYYQYSINNASDYEQISANYILGHNYVSLKQYQQAQNYLIAGLQLAYATGEVGGISNAYGQLMLAYNGAGRYDSALIYAMKYITVRDSQLGRESAGRIAEIETKYRVAQKDKELEQKNRMLLQRQLEIEKHRRQQYLWIGVAAICVFVLITVLRKRKHKMEIARLRATVIGEEQERKRLAKELHDGIVSRLSIIKMNFTALPRHHKELGEVAGFNNLVSELEQSIAELRTTSHNLMPELLQRAGLEQTLKIYCEQIRTTGLLDVDFQMIGVFPVLPDDFKLSIYRIVQELVNNIIKHSGAAHALIQFNIHPDSINLTIDDDGQGIPEDVTFGAGNGMGTLSLRDRVATLNGTMEVERGKGTSIYLVFKLKKLSVK